MPSRVEISNLSDEQLQQAQQISVPNFPFDPRMGEREISLSRNIYIDALELMCVTTPPPAAPSGSGAGSFPIEALRSRSVRDDYVLQLEGLVFTLKHLPGLVLRCDRATTATTNAGEAENGADTDMDHYPLLRCSVISVASGETDSTTERNAAEAGGPMAQVKWVSSAAAVRCEVRLYPMQFSEGGDTGCGGDWLDALSKENCIAMLHAVAEPYMETILRADSGIGETESGPGQCKYVRSDGVGILSIAPVGEDNDGAHQQQKQEDEEGEEDDEGEDKGGGKIVLQQIVDMLPARGQQKQKKKSLIAPKPCLVPIVSVDPADPTGAAAAEEDGEPSGPAVAAAADAAAATAGSAEHIEPSSDHKLLTDATQGAEPKDESTEKELDKQQEEDVGLMMTRRRGGGRRGGRRRGR